MSDAQLPPISRPWAHQRGRIYAYDFTPGDRGDPQPQAPESVVEARFAELSRDDAGALAAAMDQPVDEIHERLRQNRRCFVAWRDAEIASYCWLSFQDEYVGEMERVLNILDGEAYVWNCATLPRHRRQGLYTALLGFILHRMAREGLQRLWIGADLENVPSHRAFQSAGFLPAATFTFLRLWRLYGFLTTPLPATPPHLLPAARRLFRVDRLPSLGPLSIGWRGD